MDLDEVYRYLGNFGRYQIMAWLLLSIPGTFLPAWQMMSLVFIADQPPFHCKAAPGLTLNESVPLIDNDGNFEYSQCQMFEVHNDSIASNNTVKCANGWEYEPIHDETTIVEELDLVCSRSLLSETAQSIFFVGVLVGSIFTGQISDVFGRKMVFLGALLFEALFGIGMSFAKTYPGVVAMWFCLGIFEQGVELTQFVIVMELFSADKRTMMGAVNTVFWGVGTSSLAAIAYALPNWRHMQLAISVPCLICIPYYWLILESVRWLLSTGQRQKAKNTLHKIASINKVTLPEELLKEDDANMNEETKIEANDIQEKYTALDLFRTRNICRNSFIMFYVWTVISMVYYGLSLYSATLAGNKYINFFLLGLVEIPALTVIVFLMMWWGRRPCMTLFLLGAGVFCVITACLPEKTASGTDLSIAIITAAAIGKLCITSSFGTVWLYTTEIYPTVIRNTGFGACSLWARVGGILAPFVIYLEDTSHYLPLNIFGVMSLTAGVMGLWLPETRDRALPETIEDGENLHNAPMISKLQSEQSQTHDVHDDYAKLEVIDYETTV